MANYVLGRRTPDGINTEVKVRDMQRKLGVKVDGLWGSQTEAAYQASLKADEKQLDPRSNSERPKSVMDYLSAHFGNDAEDWSDTGLGVAGISKSNLPKTVYSEKLAQSDKALSKPYYSVLGKKAQDDPALSKNYLYDYPYAVLDDSIYVQSGFGNVEKNEKRYFPVNSAETVSLSSRNNYIDFNFEKDDFSTLLNDSLPDEDEKDILGYIKRESQYEGKMDTKRNLNENTLYLFDGRLYNKNETGNIVWGAAMRKMGFDILTTLIAAQVGTFLLTKGQRLDEPHDLAAITAGWKYIDRQQPIIDERTFEQ